MLDCKVDRQLHTQLLHVLTYYQVQLVTSCFPCCAFALLCFALRCSAAAQGNALKYLTVCRCVYDVCVCTPHVSLCCTKVSLVAMLYGKYCTHMYSVSTVLQIVPIEPDCVGTDNLRFSETRAWQLLAALNSEWDARILTRNAFSLAKLFFFFLSFLLACMYDGQDSAGARILIDWRGTGSTWACHLFLRSWHGCFDRRLIFGIEPHTHYIPA